MSESQQSPFDASFDRRALLRGGLLAAGAAAFLAACGSGREGNTEPGRVGVAPPLPTLPAGVIDDAAWLRTLQSISLGLLDVYAGIDEQGGLPGPAGALTERFVADHARTAEALGELVSSAGGAPATAANPFYEDRAILPALAAAADGSDDPERDLSNIAYNFEEWATRSYQAAITSLADPALRSAVSVFAGEAARRSTGLALAISPKTVISPELSGGQPEVDKNGFNVIYAIPSRFGQLTGLELTVGKPNADGARQKLSLQTPADNALLAG